MIEKELDFFNNSYQINNKKNKSVGDTIFSLLIVSALILFFPLIMLLIGFNTNNIATTTENSQIKIEHAASFALEMIYEMQTENPDSLKTNFSDNAFKNYLLNRSKLIENKKLSIQPILLRETSEGVTVDFDSKDMCYHPVLVLKQKESTGNWYINKIE